MFSDVFERFIQNRPIAVMVRVLLESWLNADQLDRWFDTVRQSQYTKDLLFSSIVGLMLNVVCNIRPSVHSAYRHSAIEAWVVALYGKLQNLEPTTSQGLENIRHKICLLGGLQLSGDNQRAGQMNHRQVITNR